jgi:hypothetical protein
VAFSGGLVPNGLFLLDFLVFPNGDWSRRVGSDGSFAGSADAVASGDSVDDLGIAGVSGAALVAGSV